MRPPLPTIYSRPESRNADSRPQSRVGLGDQERPLDVSRSLVAWWGWGMQKGELEGGNFPRTDTRLGFNCKSGPTILAVSQKRKTASIAIIV